MESSAPTVALADCADILTGFPFKSADYAEQGRRLLRGDNIVQGSLRWEGVKYWPSEILVQSQYQLLEGDIVLAMDRPWIEAGLKCARIGLRDTGSLLVQRVARLRANHQTHPGYLYAVIRSRDFTDYILGIQTGTGVPHISKSQIGAFRLRLPVISEQEAIGELVATIDDRISILSFAHETLESLSQSIFKSWFVDFDPVRAKAEGREPEGMDAVTATLFPDEFVQAESVLIPCGWRRVPLDEVASFLNGLALQKFVASPDEDFLPAIKIAQLKRGSVEGADPVSRRLPPQYVISDGDLIFSWSGSLEVVIWCGGKGALNQHLFKVTSDTYPLWFVYGWLLEHLDHFREIAASKVTTMGHIQRHHLHEAIVTVPDSPTLERLGATMELLFRRSIQCRLQARTLGELRDALLPRLISGKLRLPEAEKMLETVA